MFIVTLSNFGNTSIFFSAQNVVQYIIDGTIQKVQTCVFYHMTYDSIVMT
jgi:archaellum component FlaG (FlaF/FlaG flagellin family)